MKSEKFKGSNRKSKEVKGNHWKPEDIKWKQRKPKDTGNQRNHRKQQQIKGRQRKSTEIKGNQRKCKEVHEAEAARDTKQHLWQWAWKGHRLPHSSQWVSGLVPDWWIRLETQIRNAGDFQVLLSPPRHDQKCYIFPYVSGPVLREEGIKRNQRKPLRKAKKIKWNQRNSKETTGVQ